MAEEKQLLARARDYMQALSVGRDPLTGRAVAEDSVLDEPRMRRCFAFVAACLQRELSRASDAETVYLPSAAEQKELCSHEDIAAPDFYERLTDAAAAAGKAPIPAREINHFLIRSGLAEGRVESVFVERRVLRATDRAEEMGIYDKPRLSPRTGALTHTLMFTSEAQAWLLRVLPDILAESNAKEENADAHIV